MKPRSSLVSLGLLAEAVLLCGPARASTAAVSSPVVDPAESAVSSPTVVSAEIQASTAAVKPDQDFRHGGLVKKILRVCAEEPGEDSDTLNRITEKLTLQFMKAEIFPCGRRKELSLDTP